MYTMLSSFPLKFDPLICNKQNSLQLEQNSINQITFANCSGFFYPIQNEGIFN